MGREVRKLWIGSAGGQPRGLRWLSRLRRVFEHFGDRDAAASTADGLYSSPPKRRQDCRGSTRHHSGAAVPRASLARSVPPPLVQRGRFSVVAERIKHTRRPLPGTRTMHPFLKPQAAFMAKAVVTLGLLLPQCSSDLDGNAAAMTSAQAHDAHAESAEEMPPVAGHGDDTEALSALERGAFSVVSSKRGLPLFSTRNDTDLAEHLAPGTVTRVLKSQAPWYQIQVYGDFPQKGWVYLDRAGLLTPQPGLFKDDFAEVTYQPVQGRLFTGSVKPEDVMQGFLGDCYLVGALGALAMSAPETIQEAIQPGEAPGTFDVTLHRFDKNGFYDGSDVVTIDNWLPVKDGRLYYALGDRKLPRARLKVIAQGKVALWPALLEKAFAKWQGGYDKLEGGGEHSVISAITGNPVRVRSLRTGLSSRNRQSINNAISAGQPVTAASKEKIPNGGGDAGEGETVLANHVYVVEEIAPGEVTLRNPHDATVPVTVPLADFHRSFERICVGQ